MRTCEVCQRTMELSLFTTKSYACSSCIHRWWLDGPGKKRSTTGKKPKPESQPRIFNHGK